MMMFLLAGCAREPSVTTPAPVPPVPLDADTRARLAALGYVAASTPAPGNPAPTLADPKDRIDQYKQLIRLSQRKGGLP